MHSPTQRWGGDIVNHPVCLVFLPCLKSHAPTTHIVQCHWLYYSSASHHICQIIWENKHDYKPPRCSMYCPKHHSHYNVLQAQGRLNHPSSTVSQVARNAAAIAASTLLSLEPPLFEVSNNAVHSSLAKSTLTPGGKSCNTTPCMNTLQ
jgi:hypothetical protein